MFECDLCRQTTQPGDGMTKVVVETRRREYKNYLGEIVGRGIEIVREIAVGPCCKEKKS